MRIHTLRMAGAGRGGREGRGRQKLRIGWGDSSKLSFNLVNNLNPAALKPCSFRVSSVVKPPRPRLDMGLCNRATQGLGPKP